MELGTSFLKSKLARRFVTLFILCAFIPTVALIVLSYRQVVRQLEEQSFIRLKREVKAYSLSLYDRMIRIDNELQSIGRLISPYQQDFTLLHQQFGDATAEIFPGVGLYEKNSTMRSILGSFDADSINMPLPEDTINSSKPFIYTFSKDGESTRFYFGTNILRPGVVPFSVIAEVNSEYLWGIGPSPLLPPMTELSVYDKSGTNILTSENGPTGNYGDLDKTLRPEGSLHVFQFEKNGETYHAGISNLFFESRFQKVDWTIVLSTARRDIMSSMDNFKNTFPFIILLFLLLIIYLSVLFIRKGLDPLEQLKQATKRIARKDFSKPVHIESNDEFEELGNSFNTMAAKLDNQFNALTVLGEIDRAILSSLDRKNIISTTLQRLKTFFRCEIAVYAKIAESSEEHVKVYTMVGRRMSDPEARHYPITRVERERLFNTEEQFVLISTDDLHTFLNEIAENRKINFIGLPLSVDNKMTRVLLLGRSDSYVYNEDELAQARKIANQLAIGIANSKLLEDLEKLAKGTIEALARTVDAKSKWTSGHSERVSALSGKIGRIMNLPEKLIETLVRGGLLHDIGKIGIPISILDKPSKLTDKEYAEIKYHPTIGAKILEPIEAYQDILPLVKQHHEKFDGTGYPAGLKGEEIDIRARIMAVADVWDAVVSDRPYRDGWIAEKARNLIIDGKGTHFDPDVINAFLTVIAEEA